MKGKILPLITQMHADPEEIAGIAKIAKQWRVAGKTLPQNVRAIEKGPWLKLPESAWQVETASGSFDSPSVAKLLQGRSGCQQLKVTVPEALSRVMNNPVRVPVL